jgi:hypothetical protein
MTARPGDAPRFGPPAVIRESLQGKYSGFASRFTAFAVDMGVSLGVFLDRDPDAFRLYLAHRDTDLEDAPLVAGGDVLGVHPGGQPDQPGERAVTELRAIRSAILLAALGADCQGPALDGDLDVLLRVQAGKLGPDHVAVVPGAFLDPETPGRRELRRARPWRLQPVGQAREQSADYRGYLGARQLFHDVLPLHMLPRYLMWFRLAAPTVLAVPGLRWRST